MKAVHFYFLISSFYLCLPVSAQTSTEHFTHADTLRGSVTPERAWWDVLRYDIEVKPDYAKKRIRGSNEITFKVVAEGSNMQIDLQEPLEIQQIEWRERNLNFQREGNVFHVKFSSELHIGDVEKIKIIYGGSPRIAARPPWDGGWIFTTDKLGRPWMSVACQGLGASVWYPCKDYQGDEPDSGASLTITVPDTLVAVGNGRLKEKKPNSDGTTTFKWEVANPINNYNIIPYIGKYVTWHEDYMGEKGKLDCDYWVLDYDLEKAKEQFKQADSMLHCFEYWFGPYPFYEDGYKLVEAPHLGMEHQSAVAYGNRFMNGYLGTDLSGTGWGLKWDFIIVHESGHEWFGNNITTKDLADMWVHEGFTNYSETIYTECQDGLEAGDDYCIGTRKRIRNDKPIIAHYGVNEEGSGDMYYKGGNMIHTIRQVINNDSLFREILRGLNRDFYHQTVTSKQIEDYISLHAKIDFSKVFDQYLRTTEIPVLEYKINKSALSYRWANCVSGFKMPVKIFAGKEAWIDPSETWKMLKVPDGADFRVDRNFYITSKKMN
ncbi:MAG: M1 family metallopeptidase [Bacteroidetes bacterium]|nr:M1 family metallopeptidase [Bacteroidota bacterium]MBS1973836.1 M1 family metallopeptidase [Bacteroidota bacterium]